jgi:hypothetical protein
MNMNSIQKLFLVLILAGASASCRDKPNSKQIAEEKNEKTLDTRAAERDAQFVVNEISSGHAVIDWTMPMVKVNQHREMRDLAFRLQREHVRILEKWKAYAKKKNILAPDSSQSGVQAEINDYTSLKTDSAKYKLWVDEMLDQERKILSRLEDHMDDAGDPELKLLIQDEMPAIRINRDQLMMLKSKL